MLIDKISRGIATRINRSPKLQKALRGISKNPALGGAASSFILSTTLRPAAVLAITPDKDDAKFGACSSISSAFVELAGSYALFKPMNRAIEKSAKQLYNLGGSIYHENPLLLRKYKSLTNRLGKLPLTFVLALVRFSLIFPLTILLGKMGIVKKSARGAEDAGKYIFTKFAKSNAGQKFYKKITDPKYDKFMNTYLPICESGVVSSFYIISTAMQKKIDPDSRAALQWQNILSLLFSVGIAIPLNRGVGKFGEKIIKNLTPELMADGHKVVDGIRVGLPILSSILISRFIVAVGLVPISSKIRDTIKGRHKVDKVA